MAPYDVIRHSSGCSVHFQDGLFVHLFGAPELVSLSAHVVSYLRGSLQTAYASYSFVVLRWSDILHDGSEFSENAFQ